ncbi:geminin coiled-coil domain-containing protein 1 [Centroberyx affinis]|uniref:geminin coiled-coil domain-containing protein 1 n=1 Tax=Centroberyx affinis TaxID=166261 RepID=UPI003A5BB799
METLASVWTHDLSDLSDPVEEQHEPPSVWEAQCVLNYSSPPGPVWTDQLSPHLQRNKQLQDTLLQREEELVRLQEENNKLREFLNSSFVKSLEEKAKKLTADGSRKLKRSLLQADIGTFQNHGSSRLLMDSQRVSKRVCRNLTAEFCSESEMSAVSEPNLDLWVLRTLGLKDQDTIDTSNESPSRTEYTPSSSSSSEYSLSSSYNTTVTSPNHPPVFSCSFSSEYTLNSSFSPSVSTSTPPAINNSSTPVTSQHLSSMPNNHCHSPISSTGGAAATHLPATPQTPRSRTDLAFSMSLSPSSSVKTHSFPQGQAFVRKDTQGRWNFTWVPKQGGP